MLKAFKNIDQNSIHWLFIGFSLLYLACAFPFSFFRHDDWLMIGNVTRIIPNRWHFIFEPYLIFNSTPEVWFFRPWFKLILYALYKTFGFHYYGWLTINLFFTLGALLFGYLSIVEITSSVRRGILFVSVFVFSLHFHFASLVWVGEGTMNCPQLFLLFFNFYCCSRVLTSKTTGHSLFFYAIGFLSFALSLGFKEAAIFHLPFLIALMINSPQTKRLSLKVKAALFLPFATLGFGYLYFRLVLIPFNPGYKPITQFNLIVFPVLFLLASLSLPVFSLIITNIRFKTTLSKIVSELFVWCWYLILFIPFFITYVGHGFFSPGWFLAPGMYFSFVFGLAFPTSLIDPRAVRISLVLTLLLSAGLVIYQTRQLHWWSWHKPQKQILSIIQSEGSQQTQSVEIYTCSDSNRGTPHLERVVGYSSSIQELFWLNHGTLPNVNILPCEDLSKGMTPNSASSLRLKWHFPNFTVLK